MRSGESSSELHWRQMQRSMATASPKLRSCCWTYPLCSLSEALCSAGTSNSGHCTVSSTMQASLTSAEVSLTAFCHSCCSCCSQPHLTSSMNITSYVGMHTPLCMSMPCATALQAQQACTNQGLSLRFRARQAAVMLWCVIQVKAMQKAKMV